MPNNRRQRRRAGGRVTPKGTRPAADRSRRDADVVDEEPEELDEELDLLASVRARLAEDHPYAMLAEASSILAALDPRQRDPFTSDQPSGPTRDEVIESFLGVDLPETTALLYVIAALTGDELLTARIGRTVRMRSHPLPKWLHELDQIDVYRVLAQTEVLRDGDNIILGARLPGGHELTAVVYIDHNLGHLAKDAFVIPEPLAEVLALMRSHSEAGMRWDDLDAADARVRITEAIAVAAITYPRFESDTWPACRPVVEWLTGTLPEGGRGYETREWDDDEVDEIVRRVLQSPFGARLRGDEDYEDLLEVILDFASRYGPCDPFHWSPVVVELMLLDRIPRKVLRRTSVLAKAPDALRAAISFAHTERGIPPERTAETLDAVDRWQSEYQAIIRSPRPQGAAALLAAMGVVDADGPWDDPDTLIDLEDLELQSLEKRFGGVEGLDRLDAEPLPDEPFDWTGIPDDVRAPVAHVLELCDRVCDEVFDRECRTACRRLLARVGRNGAEVFRRHGMPATAAAAICWAVGRENGLIADHGKGGRPTAKDVLARLGVTGSVSQRASTILRAAGIGDSFPARRLGPEFLVGARRRSIIDRRDEMRTRRKGGAG